MYHVYLIKSEKDNSFYIGYTHNIQRRLGQHNLGEVTYTRKFKPWKLIYYESFLSLEDAQLREKNLKYFGKSYGQLKRRIANCLNT